MGCDTSRVLSVLQARAAESRDPQILGSAVVEALHEEFPKASWVGIYWLRGSELVLGPYVGPATEHMRIPVGSGVCGTAIAEDQDQIVSDVREVENYLACTPGVRSELVVLIRSRGGVIGQIDLDAKEVGAFDDLDHCVVRAIADSFGGLVDTAPLESAGENAVGGDAPAGGSA